MWPDAYGFNGQRIAWESLAQARLFAFSLICPMFFACRILRAPRVWLVLETLGIRWVLPSLLLSWGHPLLCRLGQSNQCPLLVPADSGPFGICLPFLAGVLQNCWSVPHACPQQEALLEGSCPFNCQPSYFPGSFSLRTSITSHPLLSSSPTPFYTPL